MKQQLFSYSSPHSYCEGFSYSAVCISCSNFS